jgi:hypothetical protein
MRKDLPLNTETHDPNDSLATVTVRYDEDMLGQCGG